MRSLALLALLPLAAAPALAQQSAGSASGPVGGTAVIALGTAGATIDTGLDAAAGQGTPTASGTAPAATDTAAPDTAAAVATTGTGDTAASATATGSAAAATGTTSATSSTAAAGTATAGVTAATSATASVAGATGTTGATASAGATGTDSAAAAASPSGASPSGASAGLPLEFRTMIGDKPIEITGDDATPAFEQFRQTGTNPFHGDEAALAEGKKLYAKLCQACHMPDGSGRIGPSLTDDLWRNPRLETEAGRFEIIHSGGAGAMQAFHPRMSTDEMLKVMAYIDTFRGG